MVGFGKVWQLLLRCLPLNWKDVLSSALMVSSSWTNDATANTTMMLMGEADDDDKPLLFALLRSTLAVLACISELYFLDAIYSYSPSTTATVNNDGCTNQVIKNNANASTTHRSAAQITAHFTAFTSLFASGNFHAMGSYLPSATVMSLWKMSASNMIRNYDDKAILWAIVAVLATGWPFCAALFVPIGIRAVWNAGAGGGGGFREIQRVNIGAIAHLIVRSFLHAILIGLGVALIDYHSYGFWAFPTWNIFVYNSHGGGDELYGVEPFSYYVKNLALNFNVVSLLGVMALPAVWLMRCCGGRHSNAIGMETFLLMPMYIWMALIFPRPHKEERFLYPIYPLLSYGAAITLRVGQSMIGMMSPTFDRWRQEGRARRELFIGMALLCFPAAISLSRSMALHQYYSAPVEVYRELFYRASSASTAASSMSGGITTYVCTAGEWYRFPSSFFLPRNHRLGYLKSSFNGQLPQPFTVHGSRVESLAVPGAGRFNDRNEEEMDRYIDIEMCSYVIELVPMLSSTSRGEAIRDNDVPEGMRYMDSDKSGGSWELLATNQFLDAENTPALHRILYLPSFGSRVGDDVAYKRYNLYERRR